MRAALEQLQVRRIGHGLAATRDADLLARLAAEEVYFDICTMSNQKTGCWTATAAHPVQIFDNCNIPWSLGSDDPGIFGSSLLKEIYNCHERLGLSWPSLRRALRNGFLGSFLAAADRDADLARFDAAWREPHPPAN